MSDWKFVNLVANMRQAQRSYFRSRADAELQYAKALEMAVDQAIEEHRQGTPPALFDEE